MSNEDLQTLLIKYISKFGVRQKHIANTIGMPEEVLSRFKRHGKILWPEHRQALEEYLISKTL